MRSSASPFVSLGIEKRLFFLVFSSFSGLQAGSPPAESLAGPVGGVHSTSSQPESLDGRRVPLVAGLGRSERASETV